MGGGGILFKLIFDTFPPLTHGELYFLPHFYKRGEEHSISIFYFVFLLTKEVSSNFLRGAGGGGRRSIKYYFLETASYRTRRTLKK